MKTVQKGQCKVQSAKCKEKAVFLHFALCTFLFALLVEGRAVASETQLKEGNRLFRNGHYDEALKKYSDGLIDTPNSLVLRFNAADAAYQLGNFDAAEKQFKETGDMTTNSILRGAAYYNRGNAYFRQNEWKEAVDAYKDSLRANPADEDAKYNLGVALNILKNPSQAPKQPKSGNGKQKKQDGKGQGSSQPQQKKPGEMSKEDAERLLAAAGTGEPKKPNTQAQKAGVPHPDEDW